MLTFTAWILLLVYDPNGLRPEGANLNVYTTQAQCVAAEAAYVKDGYLVNCHLLDIVTKVQEVVVLPNH